VSSSFAPHRLHPSRSWHVCRDRGPRLHEKLKPEPSRLGQPGDAEMITKSELFENVVPGFQDMFATRLRDTSAASASSAQPTNTDSNTSSTAPPVLGGGFDRTYHEPAAFDAFAKMRAMPTAGITAAVIAVMVLSLAGAQMACVDRNTDDVLTPERLAVAITPILSQLHAFLVMPDMLQLTATELSKGIAVAETGSLGYKDAQDGVYILIFEPRSKGWYQQTAEACKISWPWFAKKCLSAVTFMQKYNLESLCLQYVGETGKLLLTRTHQHHSRGTGLPGQTNKRNGRILQVRSSPNPKP
jgi:hypothetical protein